MKRRIDLENAAQAEAFGALALGGKRERRAKSVAEGRLTPSQIRALSEMAVSLVKAAKGAGAEKQRITVGDVSLELQEDGDEEILSIRTCAD
jgi:hypothetical protein